MCKILDVSRSGYYEWTNELVSNRAKEDSELMTTIKTIFREGRNAYGTRRIKIILSRKGIVISRRRINRLMKESSLLCKTKRKFKATTDSNHKLPVAPNLLARQFKVDTPNRYWVGDITYIPTEEGWLYLATVIDLHSRRVVGWSMSERIKADLVNKALLMAIWQRKPSRGLVWHTDRGSQYASNSHLEIIKQYHISQSMSRKGDCFDNAVAESFFHTLKTELIHQCKFKNREEARSLIFEYIEVFYNRIRIHSANNYLSPAEFESFIETKTLHKIA